MKTSAQGNGRASRSMIPGIPKRDQDIGRDGFEAAANTSVIRR
jgi:hypothetical protein